MNKLYLKIFIFSCFFLPQIVYSKNLPDYDNEPITPKTWKQISLEYKEDLGTTARIDLLRPNKWLNDNHAHKVGNIVRLNIPEFGINTRAMVTKILPLNININEMNFLKNNISRPVIGKFVRHVENVWSYKFSNGEIVKVTPNHLFYSATQNKYIPINEINLNTDNILTESGRLVTISEKHQLKKGVHTVYNMEVYQRHNYFIGNDKLLVHNNCPTIVNIDLDMESRAYVRIDGNETLKTINAMGEGASLKALNMESGGARHLFDITDGLGYPSKKSTDYYHFVFDTQDFDISKTNASHFGLKASSFNIEKVNFPGKLGDIAARGEWRVAEGSINSHDALSINVGHFDSNIRHTNGILTFGLVRENSHIIYKINFNKIISNLDTLKKYGSIPINF